MLAPIIVLILRILLVVVLYSFLWWTIYTLWKDLKIKKYWLFKFKRFQPLL